ncbi:hypothetical protein Ancab_024388, partial [Ancistrocladus abbreviatus]
MEGATAHFAWHNTTPSTLAGARRPVVRAPVNMECGSPAFQLCRPSFQLICPTMLRTLQSSSNAKTTHDSYHPKSIKLVSNRVRLNP